MGSKRDRGQSFATAYEQVASVLLARGVLLVAAAGNNSNRPLGRQPVENPAACPSIQAIAGIDCNHRIGYFSCAATDAIGKIAMSAPGVRVYSAWQGKTQFASKTGTSMATPHVAGVAALFFELHPDLSANDIWALMVESALKLGDPSDYGCGLVQVPQAVD